METSGLDSPDPGPRLAACGVRSWSVEGGSRWWVSRAYKPSRAIAEDVDRRPVQVSGWVLHPAHPVPPLPDPEECLLPDVLRFGLCACDRKQGFVETALLGAEELLERRNRSAQRRFLS